MLTPFFIPVLSDIKDNHSASLTTSTTVPASVLFYQKAIPRITKDLNYLVIGTMASRDWANSSHGRKIEKAMEFRKDKCLIFIINEKQWVENL